MIASANISLASATSPSGIAGATSAHALSNASPITLSAAGPYAEARGSFCMSVTPGCPQPRVKKGAPLWVGGERGSAPTARFEGNVPEHKRIVNGAAPGHCRYGLRHSAKILWLGRYWFGGAHFFFSAIAASSHRTVRSHASLSSQDHPTARQPSGTHRHDVASAQGRKMTRACVGATSSFSMRPARNGLRVLLRRRVDTNEKGKRNDHCSEIRANHEGKHP